jgi:hypothetical protein
MADTAASVLIETKRDRFGARGLWHLRSAREVVAVTVFQIEAQLLRAMNAVAPLRRRHVLPLVAAKPERGGVVMHYRAAGMAAPTTSESCRQR